MQELGGNFCDADQSSTARGFPHQTLHALLDHRYNGHVIELVCVADALTKTYT